MSTRQNHYLSRVWDAANPLCVGLYELDRSMSAAARGTATVASESTLSFIGIALCITDFTTFIYLTDLYIEPSYQRKGLEPVI